VQGSIRANVFGAEQSGDTKRCARPEHVLRKVWNID
jgi:hypothetical protein